MRLFKSPVVGLALGLVLAVLVSGCGEVPDPNGTRARKEAVASRNEVFSVASSLYPDPKPENFPSRAALVEFTLRQDEVGKAWYVYLLGDNGNAIGYYVAKTRPINSCNFLSSTEAVDRNDSGTVVLTAPSLDGIYYGGAGGTAACSAFFFFDAATDALIEISGLKFFVTDQPLRLAADPIVVEAASP